MAEDSGRQYVTNAVIFEKLEQQAKIIEKIDNKVDILVDKQTSATVERETIRGRIKQLECDSAENKDEHKSLRNRQTNYDIGAYVGNLVAGILAAIGIGMK